MNDLPGFDLTRFAAWSAHDMTREYRVMTALRDTSVPVPLPYALVAAGLAALRKEH